MSDIIIVLGNYLLDDGNLSLINRERCFHAYGLYKANKNCILLLSGGKANTKAPFSEAEAMRNYFLEQGVSKESILTETQSKNTFENTKFCGEILKNMQWEKLILVSSSYHVNRGYFNPVTFFKKYQHLQVAPSPCFDSGIKEMTVFDREKNTELVIFSNKKKLQCYVNNGNKNYFAISKRGKQRINKKKCRFFASASNINELTCHLKDIYMIDNVNVKII